MPRETQVEFDYIIVGAGSAGCVLANRLSADAANRVLLIEAGPNDTGLSLKMPAAVLSNLNSTRHNWAFDGEPEPQLNDRRIRHPRGRTLGGSSSINGMVFIRGHALDFDGWRQAGCDGWGYADVLPYFRRMEAYSGGGDRYRGDAGPLQVLRPKAENPLYRAFLEAGEQAGHPRTDDINGYRQEGFGLLDSTVFRGSRWSAARAYLDPARNRPNLTVFTGTLVHRVAMKDGRATGIRCQRGGIEVSLEAAKEVILSAGAVGSPHLLMLSGIGPSVHLRNMGVAVIHDLPGVGRNLQDHPDFVLKYRCRRPVTIWPKTRPLQRIAAGATWLLTRKGVCSSNQFDVVGCIRSARGIDYPDLQLTLSPIAVDGESWEPLPEHAFQVHLGLMRAHSRGSVTLRDSNPFSPPRILVNYLEDERDRELMRRGIRLVRNLVAQPAFKDLCGAEIFPGADAQSDEDLDAHLRADTATQWHLSGTARMGASKDLGAVVDPQGRVHGISGLRVVDASIMPTVTNGNTNGPTIMIAEKLSDTILGRAPLPRIDAEIWQHPDHHVHQGQQASADAV